jgi:SAM-dependent methyltransferase
VKTAEYAKMYGAERRFWWFVAKEDLVSVLARKWLPAEGLFLDLGCGTGANLDRVRGRGRWIGLDAGAEALRFCAERGLPELARAEAGRLPFGAETFDGAMALDLFEHLLDDAAAAAELGRVLRPGGRLLVTVPAYPGLFGAHDHALGHRRRYRGADLRRLLADAGLRLVHAGHFLGLLFPLMLPVRLWQKRHGSRAETISYDWPPALNRLLLAAAALELRLFAKRPLPFGTTLFAVAEKPGGN